MTTPTKLFEDLCNQAETTEDAEIQFQVGVIYSEGSPTYQVNKDDNQAFVYLKKAAEQNHIEAQHYLGEIYLEIYKTQPDYAAKIITLLTTRGNQDSVTAEFFLGSIYKRLNEIESNINHEKQAIAWYEKAANKKDACSQYHLGLMYLNRFKKTPTAYDSRKKAIKWFKEAAQQGYNDAVIELKQMKERGELTNYSWYWTLGGLLTVAILAYNKQWVNSSSVLSLFKNPSSSIPYGNNDYNHIQDLTSSLNKSIHSIEYKNLGSQVANSENDIEHTVFNLKREDKHYQETHSDDLLHDQKDLEPSTSNIEVQKPKNASSIINLMGTLDDDKSIKHEAPVDGEINNYSFKGIIGFFGLLLIRYLWKLPKKTKLEHSQTEDINKTEDPSVETLASTPPPVTPIISETISSEPQLSQKKPEETISTIIQPLEPSIEENFETNQNSSAVEIEPENIEYDSLDAILTNQEKPNTDSESNQDSEESIKPNPSFTIIPTVIIPPPSVQASPLSKEDAPELPKEIPSNIPEENIDQNKIAPAMNIETDAEPMQIYEKIQSPWSQFETCMMQPELMGNLSPTMQQKLMEHGQLCKQSMDALFDQSLPFKDNLKNFIASIDTIKSDLINMMNQEDIVAVEQPKQEAAVEPQKNLKILLIKIFQRFINSIVSFFNKWITNKVNSGTPKLGFFNSMTAQLKAIEIIRDAEKKLDALQQELDSLVENKHDNELTIHSRSS